MHYSTSTLCFLSKSQKTGGTKYKSAGKGNNCTIEAFKVAQNVFTSSIGLYAYMDWNDPMSLLIGVQRVLVSGYNNETGLVAVCR